jgi:hypothetical protein
MISSAVLPARIARKGFSFQPRCRQLKAVSARGAAIFSIDLFHHAIE